MQTERNKNSRTYLDYNSVEAAMDGLCRDFEKQLKRLNPNLPSITYDVQDLFLYIDNMPDMSALVYDQGVTAYIPCNKEWIKKKVYQHLKDAMTKRR
eukprot:jgi/Astpho2/4564/Aster-00146